MEYSELKNKIVYCQKTLDKNTKDNNKQNYLRELELIPEIMKSLDDYRTSLQEVVWEKAISNIMLRISYFYQKTINEYHEYHITESEENSLDEAYLEINKRCNPYLYELTNEQRQLFRNIQMAYAHNNLAQFKYYYLKCAEIKAKPISCKLLSQKYYDIIRDLTYYDNATIYYHQLEKIKEELNDQSLKACFANAGLFERSLNHLIDYHNFF